MDERKLVKRYPENLLFKLNHREVYGCKKPGTQFNTKRNFYQNIFPNFSVTNVKKPPCLLHKFSPDGKRLIAFSSDRTSLEIYLYRGPAAASDLLQNITNENSQEHQIKTEVKSSIFERLFHLKYFINVTSSGQLNQECSLFSNDSRYVIIGSSALMETPPDLHEIYTNNECFRPNEYFLPLQNYTLHLVDIHLGIVSDTKTFKADKIFLCHNQGIYLYNDTLAVLSVQHQTIHIFQIINGMFVEKRQIGRFCYEDDLYLYNLVPSNIPPFKEVSINSLKHRVLTFMFKKASDISIRTGWSIELSRFFHFFNHFKSLKMWKMQLLDDNQLFIKYGRKNCYDENLFVVYNINDCRVTAVYEDICFEMQHLFENSTDYFRNACIYNEITFSSSMHSHGHMKSFGIPKCKYNTGKEALNKLLNELPISAQTYSCSPYLDLSLFSFVDNWISEGSNGYGNHSIRFYDRKSGYLKFRTYLGETRNDSKPSSIFEAYIFHPTDPFAISVQKSISGCMVNFHIRQHQPEPKRHPYNEIITKLQCC